MPKENNINQILEEIKLDAEKLCGWDNLKVISINKYGIEAVIKTDHGDLKMSMKELFTQYFFMLKVFETFGIALIKVKQGIYEKWLVQWADTIVDMTSEYGGTLDLLKECLSSYLENAEEKDTSYLKKGEPIIILNNLVAFRANEFSMWLKKNHGITYTNDQLYSVLNDIGCSPRSIGKERVRAWTYKIKELQEESLFKKDE